MGRFVINGGKTLGGEIFVGGSKNAALPIIFSCITTYGVSTLTNVPNISDVAVALEILSDFGAVINRTADTVTVDTRELSYCTPDESLVSKIRASSYLIGACLSRFGRADIQHFGGCNFDNRPIDMHLMAAKTLGAKIDDNIITADELCGGDIHFEKISVGATINAILMSVSAKGKTRIFGYAREPHIIALVEFLCSAGAKIKLTEEYIEIEGTALSSSNAKIITDMIEAGTYLSLSLVTGSTIRVIGADKNQLSSFLKMLLYAGAVIEFDDQSVTVSGEITDPADIVTAPYPAFPTDLQPVAAPLLAAFCGGIITEGVWYNRFGYLAELAKFGVCYELGSGFAKIKKSSFNSAQAAAPDLRGGAALLITALAAQGESIIDCAELIKRGYSDIVNKLLSVGADIKEL